MKVTDGELAALVAEFDKFGNKTIVCSDFMVRFTTLGCARRDAARLAQLEKQRRLTSSAQVEAAAKKKALDEKLDLDESELQYDEKDLASALEKIRVLAANYDRSHPSAPSLKGFMGTDMKPAEFKQMMMRTFSVAVTNQEVGALVDYFNFNNPSVVNGTALPSLGLVNTQGFLTHFNKIQRDEQSKRHSARIERDREAIRQQQEEKRQKMLKKQREDLLMLVFTPKDEESFLAQIKKAAQAYAIDTALFIEPLQGFKGPGTLTH
jgi:flagellum-specific peptidoglycan hydrolase FlgJ